MVDRDKDTKEADQDERGDISKKKMQSLQKRRNLNRINARKSRIRKTFRFETLKQQLDLTLKQSVTLREMVKKNLNVTLKDILGTNPEPLTFKFVDDTKELPVPLLESESKPTKPATALQPEEKLARKRQLNRINARKSRMRKKAQQHGMHAKIEALNRENELLNKALSKKVDLSESVMQNNAAFNSVAKQMQSALEVRLCAEDERAMAEATMSKQLTDAESRLSNEPSYGLPRYFIENNPIHSKTSSGSGASSSTANNKSGGSTTSSGKTYDKSQSGDSESKSSNSKSKSSLDDKSSSSSDSSLSRPRKKNKRVAETVKALCSMRYSTGDDNSSGKVCTLCERSHELERVSIHVCKKCKEAIVHDE